MTEKNYGGANSFGFKDKPLKGNSETSMSVSSKKDKKELVKSELSPKVIENYLKAGSIVAQIRKELNTIVKKDVLLIDIAEKIEARIVELGGKPAFPVNTSIDEIAAHYTPIVDDKTVASGLLKVDFGVEVGGFIADNAVSFDFSEGKIHQEMIDFNNKLLDETLDQLEIGSPMKTIGNKVSELISSNGKYKIIRNLSGHSVEEDSIHAGLTILNTPNESSKELKDIAIAVEPFLTTGLGEIYEGRNSEIYLLQSDRVPRDKEARKLLDFIKENYRTKPFCKRWLIKAGLEKINFPLLMLVRDGIVYNFPALIERDKKPVSQAEHTVLFADKVYITTKN